MKLRNQFTVVVVYLAVIVSTVALATLRNQVRGAQTAASRAGREPATQPGGQAALFALDQSDLRRGREGARLHRLSGHRFARLPRLSGQRPVQVLQTAQQPASTGRRGQSRCGRSRRDCRAQAVDSGKTPIIQIVRLSRGHELFPGPDPPRIARRLQRQIPVQASDCG